jgi:transcriptional regulator with XRE-family HTH domain
MPIMKMLRKRKGLTQQQVAERLHVTQQYISKLENGYAEGLTLYRLLRLSVILDACPCEVLFALIKQKGKGKNCLLFAK